MNKKIYENVTLEVIILPASDVITTSGAFNGKDDDLSVAGAEMEW